MCSGIFKHVSMFLWLIASLACINIGMQPFGYNLFNFLQAYPQALLIIHYLIGIAGIASLVMLLGAKCHKTCGCGCATK